MSITSPADSHQTNHAQPIFTLDQNCDLDTFESLVKGTHALELSNSLRVRVTRAHTVLCQAIQEGRHIYGINTGFGALAGRLIDPNDLEKLQRNLVYHLATGVGDPLSYKHSRALLLARLLVLSKGHSGCDPALLNLMAGVLNAGLAPVVPRKGTVGASGDLTPSSHMALALMGEGAFINESGQQIKGVKALVDHGLTPLALSDRTGLALVNGTSAMTGIAALNAIEAERAVSLALRSSAVYADIMGVRLEAWSADLATVRPHPGQVRATYRLSDLLERTARADPRFIADRQADENISGTGEHIWPQDPYSLRCMPQLFGAVFDMLSFHTDIVERELHAVTDNPIIVENAPFAIHGGNFYGQHVAFASDALLMALVKTAILLERQMARLTDETFNKGLPPFLQPNASGLNSGFMGAQVTASALIAEMRSLATPASIQSVPTNGNNQDVNTMGTIAARKAADGLDDLFSILAIHALGVAQAFDLLVTQKDCKAFAPASQSFVMRVRAIAPMLDEDRPLSEDIGKVAMALRNGDFALSDEA